MITTYEIARRWNIPPDQMAMFEQDLDEYAKKAVAVSITEICTRRLLEHTTLQEAQDEIIRLMKNAK